MSDFAWYAVSAVACTSAGIGALIILAVLWESLHRRITRKPTVTHRPQRDADVIPLYPAGKQ